MTFLPKDLNLDIHQLPNFTKAVDTIVERIKELELWDVDKQSYSEIARQLQRQIALVRNFRQEYKDDPRISLLDAGLFRLRSAVFLLQSTKNREAENVKKVSPTQSSSATPHIDQETIAVNEDTHEQLNESGHYRSQTADPRNEDGSLDFMIVMTEEEWKAYKLKERKKSAERRHYNRRKQQTGPENSGTEVAATDPFIDHQKLQRQLHR